MVKTSPIVTAAREVNKTMAILPIVIV
jgi:hypothetical protein